MTLAQGSAVAVSDEAEVSLLQMKVHAGARDAMGDLCTPFAAVLLCCSSVTVFVLKLFIVVIVYVYS